MKKKSKKFSQTLDSLQQSQVEDQKQQENTQTTLTQTNFATNQKYFQTNLKYFNSLTPQSQKKTQSQPRIKGNSIYQKNSVQYVNLNSAQKPDISNLSDQDSQINQQQMSTKNLINAQRKTIDFLQKFNQKQSLQKKNSKRTIFGLDPKFSINPYYQDPNDLSMVLSTTRNIKKFIQIIKDRASFNFFSSLNYIHVKYIADKAYYSEQNQKMSIFQQLYILLAININKIDAFMPDQPIIILWNLLMFLVLVSQIIAIPIKVAFEQEFDDSITYQFLIFIPTIVCILDVILRFNTAYYKEGEIIKNHAEIFKRYTKWNFWFDLITSFTLLFKLQPYYQIIFLLRMHQMGDIIDEVDEKFQLQTRFPMARVLIRMFVQIIINAHLSSCIFHSIGGNTNWLETHGFSEENWKVRYINSLYFSVINMSTVGFGVKDIYPTSDREKIYVIFVTLLSCGQYGYVINTIGQIFADKSQKQADFKAEKYTVQKYMQNRNMNPILIQQVIKYLEYIKGIEQDSYDQAQYILNKVTLDLQTQIKDDYYGNLLNNQMFFKRNFTQKFVQLLAQRMREVVYGPGQTIYKLGEFDNRIFIIFKGQVELCLPLNQELDLNKQNQLTQQKFMTYQKLKKGDIFGQEEFLTNKQRDTFAKSVGITQMVYVTQDDLISILHENELKLDFERFCMLRDNILHYQDSDKQQCFACNIYRHSIINCPKLHCVRNKQFVILRHEYSKDQERQSLPFNRNITKFQSFLQNKTVKYKLKSFRITSIMKAIQYQEKKKELEIIQKAFLSKGETNLAYNTFSQLRLLQTTSQESDDDDGDETKNKSKFLKKKHTLNIDEKQFVIEDDFEFFIKVAKINYENKHWVVYSDHEDSLNLSELTDDYLDELQENIGLDDSSFSDSQISSEENEFAEDLEYQSSKSNKLSPPKLKIGKKKSITSNTNIEVRKRTASNLSKKDLRQPKQSLKTLDDSSSIQSISEPDVLNNENLNIKFNSAYSLSPSPQKKYTNNKNLKTDGQIINQNIKNNIIGQKRQSQKILLLQQHKSKKSETIVDQLTNKIRKDFNLQHTKNPLQSTSPPQQNENLDKLLKDTKIDNILQIENNSNNIKEHRKQSKLIDTQYGKYLSTIMSENSSNNNNKANSKIINNSITPFSPINQINQPKQNNQLNKRVLTKLNYLKSIAKTDSKNKEQKRARFSPNTSINSQKENQTFKDQQLNFNKSLLQQFLLLFKEEHETVLKKIDQYLKSKEDQTQNQYPVGFNRTSTSHTLSFIPTNVQQQQQNKPFSNILGLAQPSENRSSLVQSNTNNQNNEELSNKFIQNSNKSNSNSKSLPIFKQFLSKSSYNYENNQTLEDTTNNHQQSLIQRNLYLVEDLDTMYIATQYFPYGNYSKIIQKYNIQIQRNKNQKNLTQRLKQSKKRRKSRMKSLKEGQPNLATALQAKKLYVKQSINLTQNQKQQQQIKESAQQND